MLQALVAPLQLEGRLAHIFQEGIHDRPPGHSHRALGDDDVLFLGVDVRLLVGQGGVALLRGHKAGGHLHGVHAQLHGPLHVAAVIDPAGQGHRDLNPVFVSKALYHIQDPADLSLVLLPVVGGGHVLRVHAQAVQILPGKSQVAAGQRSLDHHQIRHSLVLSVPQLADHVGGFGCGDDGGNLGLKTFDQTGQIHGKSGAGHDNVRSRLHRLLHIEGVVVGSHHNVESQNPARGNLPGLFELLADGSQIGLQGFLPEIRLPKSDLGGGNQADSAGLGHSPGQGVETDSHSHSPLYNRHLRCQIPYH